MNSVSEIQAALNEQGYRAGPVDGVRGRMTITAIRAFQRKNGLFPDAIVGPKTRAKLFKGDASASGVKPTSDDLLPWMSEAKRVKGLHESRNHSRISRWLRSDGATVGDPAKIPWCGDFCQTAIALSMPDEPIPENPYLAANWMKFGTECKPQFGCVLVFWRGSPSSWKGHVGFYVGESGSHFHVLGGNQSNAVTITKIAKNRLRKGGSRWPLTAPDGDGKTRYADGKGLIITTNEA